MKRKIVSIMIILAIILNQSLVVFASGDNSIQILGQPTATVAQMKTWARDKGATDTFVSLADTYYYNASEHGGVNPVVAYAQFAKETGYGKFGGVIDASYFNPCGLKKTAGGGDYDSNAHQRFANWSEGISAHLDHLALYAGASGYPRTGNTPDPRHFNFLAGAAKTVQELGAKWAPSSNYGIELAKMVMDINATVPRTILPTLMTVDSPSDNFKFKNRDLNIGGWIMSQKLVNSIKIYVNNTFAVEANKGIRRADVYSAFPEYDNKNSGFSATVDKKFFNDGNNVVTIEANLNDGNKTSVSKNIKYDALLPAINIETPNSNVVTDDVNVRGWSVAMSGIKEVDVYLNDVLLGAANHGNKRPDVAAVFSDYSQAVDGEYRYTVNKGLFKYGNNKLRVTAMTNAGESVSMERNMVVEPYKTFGTLDNPASEIVNNKVRVSGWILDAYGISQAKVYLDDKYVDNAVIGGSRPDVASAYPRYNGAANSGFSYELNSDDIATGIHNVKLQFVNKNGENITLSKDFNYKNLGVKMFVETLNADNYGMDDIIVRGWAINYNKISDITISVNGKEIAKANYGLPRPDVQSVFRDYPEATNSGFKYTISASNLVKGKNTIVVVARGLDGKTLTYNKDINVYVLEKFALDKPSQGSSWSDKIDVSGWALLNSDIKEVNVLVDGKFVGKGDLGVERQDVAAVYPLYKNDNSGFKYSIDGSQLADGNHVVRVELVVSDGNMYAFEKIVRYTNSKNIVCIDTPDSSKINKADLLKVKGWSISKAGIKNVSVIIDGKNYGNVNYGLIRTDVAAAFPAYNNSNSGFEGNIDISSLSDGNHVLEVVATTNDNKEARGSKVIFVGNLGIRMFLDSPSSVVYSGNDVKISGWAINLAKITSVSVKVNGRDLGNAKYGISRPDVFETFSNYPDETANSGFELVVSKSQFNSLKNIIEVIVKSEDGKTVTATKEINVLLEPIICLDKPQQATATDGNLDISGWALFQDGIRFASIYVDEKLVDNLTTDIERTDVKNAYPQYNCTNSGFSKTINLKGLSQGKHSVRIEFVSNLGDVKSVSKDIVIRGKLIVVDPGHNMGIDSGAQSRFGEILYDETSLNMQVASRLASELENRGYRVLLTRVPGQSFVFKKVTDSLKYRTNFANTSGADMFISIHHDANDKDSTSGVSTHYSSYRPGIDNSGIKTIDDIDIDTTPSPAAVKSKELATAIGKALNSKMGYSNNGARDHNLYVTEHTNMPSVLVECGFLTNSIEAQRSANPDNQQKVAQTIADTIEDVLN